MQYTVDVIVIQDTWGSSCIVLSLQYSSSYINLWCGSYIMYKAETRNEPFWRLKISSQQKVNECQDLEMTLKEW